jgi:hypothetical protein
MKYPRIGWEIGWWRGCEERYPVIFEILRHWELCHLLKSVLPSPDHAQFKCGMRWGSKICFFLFWDGTSDELSFDSSTLSLIHLWILICFKEYPNDKSSEVFFSYKL